MELDGNGPVVLVTGAAGDGIGRATVEEFLARHARVAVTDRSQRRTAAVAAELQEKYGSDRVRGWEFDVADRARARIVVDEVTATFGPVDVLVNNAGVNVVGDVHELSAEAWDQVISVNLSAPWFLSALVLPSMRERRRGIIVMVGSVAAYASDSLARGPYAASKAGLESLTRTIAAEGGPFGVRCVGVHPGIIETAWIRNRVSGVEFKDKPVLDRYGQPKEVAKVIAFLASDDASYITGETVTVSGGFKMRP
jgi:NAD(P)-dependent dehydrogenase (short-subunit alcohol dehydrogenase family)